MIVGIILSAGESKRMCPPKQLLPWGKTIMLQKVIENADTSRLGHVLVVLGHPSDEIAAKIMTSSKKTRILVNHDFRAGMSSSIKLGIKNAPADAEAFMLLPGDQPFISVNIIDQLIDSYRAGGHGIVIPVYDGRRGHPVILDLRYGEELLSISDQGAREVVKKHARDIFEVCINSPNVLNDIDKPKNYQEAKKQDGEQQ